MSITLKNAKGASMVFGSSNRDLKQTDTFVKAQVTTGSWILYREKNYNASLGNGATKADSSILDTPSSPSEVDISSINGSLYLLSSDQQAITLFQFQYYGGDQKDYTTQQGNIGDIFKDGAFAAVVGNENSWIVYPKPGFGEPHQTLVKGSRCTTADAMGVPSVKSIKPQ